MNNVSFIAYEIEKTQMEHKIKRNFAFILALLGILIGSNLVWILRFIA